LWGLGRRPTAQFLRQVRGHRLYALFHLTALRGLRRGEAAWLKWGDLDLDTGTLTVTDSSRREPGERFQPLVKFRASASSVRHSPGSASGNAAHSRKVRPLGAKGSA
jgi:integrase